MAYSSDQSPAQTHPAEQQSPPLDQSQYRLLDEPFDLDGKDVHTEVISNAKEAKMAKRREEERRLTGNHDMTPRDAQPIDPVPRFSAPREPRQPNAKKVSKSFKPVDTLHVQAHAPKASLTALQNGHPTQQLRRLEPPRVSVSGTVVIDMDHARRISDEQRFHDHELPSAKRQKTGHSAVTTATRAPYSGNSTVVSPIASFYKPMERSQKASEPYSDSPFSSRETSAKDLDRSIARKVDKNAGLTGEKNRRKSRDGAHSSNPSTVASLHASPIVIPDDDVELLSSRTDANRSQARSFQRSSVGEESRKPLFPDNDSDAFASNAKLHTGSRNQSDHQESQPEQRLEEKFKRDDIDVTKRPRLPAPQRMQATSTKPGDPHAGRNSTGSMDELSGETTVGTSVRRAVPSEPFRAQANTGVPTSKKKTQSRAYPAARRIQISTSKPGIHPSIAETDDTTLVDQSNEFPDSPKRISVVRLLCKACCFDTGDIQLVWVAETGVFQVKRNGIYQTLPNKNRLVEIGGGEVRSAGHANKEGMLAVHIKGPSSDISNGHILMEFPGSSELREFIDLLLVATHDHLVVEAIPRKTMEGILQTTGREIQKGHSRATQTAVNQQSSNIAFLENRKRLREHRDASDEEQIKYESDNSNQLRQSKRSRMRSGGSEGAHAPPTTSKYFPNDDGEPRRHSSRQPRVTQPRPPSPIRWTQTNNIERWSHSVVYPPEGAIRRVTVDFDDLERLDEGEFLNDNLISFALRRIEESMSAEHKPKVHFFNSFFYEALTMKNGKKGFYYDAVSRWTKNKDLFDLPYVVVPINAEFHWFVVIICNLNNLPRKPSNIDLVMDESTELVNDEPPHATEQIPPSISGNIDSESTLTALDPEVSLDHLSLSDHDTAGVRHLANKSNSDYGGNVQVPSSSQPTTTIKKKGKKAPPPSRKYAPDAPTIITLDSMGSTHPGEVRTLKDYLNAEANTKRGMMVDSKDLQGMTAKGIPEQTNFCDCGVFLVGYIEEFAKDPGTFVHKVLQRELDKQNDFATFNPSAKRAEIREELLNLQEQQDADRKTKKLAKKNGSTAELAAPSAKATLQVAELSAKTKNTEVNRQLPSSQALMAHVVVPKTSSVVDSSRTAATLPRQEDELVDDIPMSVPRPLPSSSSNMAPGQSKPEVVPDSQELVA